MQASAQVSKLTFASTTQVVASQSGGQAPPPPPPPKQGWNPRCSVPQPTSAPAPMPQVDATIMRKVESNSASQTFPSVPLQSKHTQQENRRSTIVEERSNSPKP